MADASAPEREDLPAAPASGGSWLSKLLMLAALGLLVAAECLGAYLLIPGPEQVAALAQSRMAAADQEAEVVTENGAIPGAAAEQVVEVDVGSYSVSAPQPASNITLRVDFNLWATVAEADRAEFDTVFAQVQNRFREQVIFEIRNADLEDLNDPGLVLIKRRILEKSNKLFGKPLIRSIVFSDFSLIEQ